MKQLTILEYRTFLVLTYFQNASYNNHVLASQGQALEPSEVILFGGWGLTKKEGDAGYCISNKTSLRGIRD